jgi:hypothetical protein
VYGGEVFTMPSGLVAPRVQVEKLVEARMKPEPVTVTDVPGGPEVGERTIAGTTLNVV